MDARVADRGGSWTARRRTLKRIPLHTRTQLVPAAADRRKVLLGLNFYGYDFAVHGAASPILGSAAMEHLEHSENGLEWHTDVAEHSFRYRDSHGQAHVVYYPTVEVPGSGHGWMGSVGVGSPVSRASARRRAGLGSVHPEAGRPGTVPRRWAVDLGDRAGPASVLWPVVKKI